MLRFVVVLCLSKILASLGIESSSSSLFPCLYGRFRELINFKPILRLSFRQDLTLT